MASNLVPSSPLPELRATFFLPARLLPAGEARVHGVVLDVPLDAGVDTLAAYADGTARYINHTGRTIIWEVPEAAGEIGTLVGGLLRVTEGVLPYVEPAGWAPPPEEVGRAQVTVLTRAGLATLPLINNQVSQDLFGAGAALMNALLERALGGEAPAGPAAPPA